ncbi:hypothetical protein PG997_013288 [Apiospora hydei]|uniref:Uncharacterized protein n=1 Tax=Apiospora hydei TaxID=1337664 RepID=A0ABR1V5R3_9PEZI
MSEHLRGRKSSNREQEKASDISLGNPEEATSQPKLHSQEKETPGNPTQPRRGRRNAMSELRLEEPITQAHNSNIFGNHPNPLSSNPVVITEQLAHILASENTPPPLPPSSPHPSPPPSPHPWQRRFLGTCRPRVRAWRAPRLPPIDEGLVLDLAPPVPRPLWPLPALQTPKTKAGGGDGVCLTIRHIIRRR